MTVSGTTGPSEDDVVRVVAGGPTEEEVVALVAALAAAASVRNAAVEPDPGPDLWADKPTLLRVPPAPCQSRSGADPPSGRLAGSGVA